MKTITTYQCEVCGYEYAQEASARECESQPIPTTYPAGVIWGNPLGEFYAKMSFAVKEHVRCVGRYSHSTDHSLWACRDNGAGDSLGEDTCAGQNELDVPPYNPAWLSLPHFIRLADWLRSQNITPMVILDGKIVTLDSVTPKEP